MGQHAQPAPVVAEQPSSPKLLDRVRAAIRARHQRETLLGRMGNCKRQLVHTRSWSIGGVMPFARIVVLALLLGAFAAFAQSHTPAPHHVVPLHTFSPGQWVEKVSGDFSKPGEPFVFRIHQDAGYITLPHFHPIDEHITVVKGTWSLGMGRRFNQSALEVMETGTYGMAPKNMAHFAWSKTETILQVHGIGPFASTVVEPVYELTDQGVFSLTSLLLPGVPTSASPPDCFALKVNDQVRGDAGEGRVVGARCSPSNQITQYWIQKPNGERFWAALPQLKKR